MVTPERETMKARQHATAEQSVIGSLLIDPRCAGPVFEKLRAESFGDSTHRNIFDAIYRLFLANKPIDPVMVLGELGSENYAPLLADIMRLTPTAANVLEYAALVKEYSMMRRLNSIGAQLALADSYEEGLKILAKAEGMLAARPTRRAATYAEMINRYLDRQNDTSKPDYLDWGFESLNRLCVTPGKFIILGADSSVGKTAFALQLAINMAYSGKNVGFFSYETSEQDVIDRILANTANIAISRSKSKKLTDGDFRMAAQEGQNAAKAQLTMIESAEYTIDDIRAETLAGRFEVIFIDYVQLIPYGSSAERWQTVSGASMALHSMAQRLGVTIIALSQVTLPEPGKKGIRPHVRKENLRESRQLIMDADVILMLDLEKPNIRNGPRVIFVDKNKDGPLAEIRMRFDPLHMRFTPMKRDEAEENGEQQKLDF